MNRDRIVLSSVLSAVLALSPLGAALAQTSTPAPVLNVGTSEHAIARKLDLSIGRSLIVELPRDAKEVFVANPKVANAVVRSARKLFIIGIADGSTSMFVIDGEGRQITALEIEVGRDLNVLRQTLRTALPRAQIEIKPAGNSILLVGNVANASEATQAVDIANAFVGTTAGLFSSSKGAVINSLTIRGRDQVMVKVVVSEVSRKAIKQLGINSTGEWKLGNFSVMPTIDNPLPLQPQALAATAITAGIGNSTNFTLRALERAGLSRVLAEPTVTAISGESAKFTAGGEVPVPSGYTCDANNLCTLGITYRPIGVALNFTPIVLSDNKISMRIATEVTELDFENQLRLSNTSNTSTAQNVNAPAFRVRKSDTTVELPSGGTLATAGLIQRVSKSSINGFPGLMNLPIIGVLFRSRDYQREETELMITATPYIAKPMEPNQVQRPDDGFVDAHDAQAILLGRLNKIYGTSGGPLPQAYKGRVGFIAD
ncbi:type II and III secretion system protein family protein [Bosea sp. (in: a-proteobacteria)]|uniref:type II and III secretion system protein family protein n=1 Tax=Bosea sp. (in: a-proteobacteria) TaxID=1871050 RepID=UPI002733ECD0|nr:type II and III secretion system protein family protein [Bosea sp. (in: a-proteobacteria)]MDP3407345.1 type II and III secretion system protein family protein [Bosea sp. (in: a-proteobacteria)]